MAKNKSDTRDSLVEEMMDIFEWAYREATYYLNGLDEIQQVYDNEPDVSQWPTFTQMPAPYAFNAVEKQLPQAVDYLFPRKQMLHLNPIDDVMDMESIQRSERYLQHTIRNVLKLKKNGYPTIKDCFKLGIGYGIVEPINVTPFVSKRISVRGGTKEQKMRQMQLSNKVIRSVRYKYISPAQVIPTPDGSTCNGNNRASTVFYLDFYSEEQIRDLYSDAVTDGEDKKLLGTADEIIQLARDRDFNTRVPVADMIAALGGMNLKLGKNHNERIPVLVPVLKCYSEKQHIWIACGEKVIWKEENVYQTMRCPITKATAWPDAERWYPTTPPWVTRKLSRGLSVFTCAMVDMLAQYFDPPMVYNAAALDGDPPKGNAGEKIPMKGLGRLEDAVGYLKSPPMPPAMFSVGDMLRQVYGDAVNQPEFMANAQAGIMRGGGFAFGDLTKPITMRDALAAAILETTWLDDVIRQTMIEVQLMAMSGTGKLSFVERAEEYDDESNEFIEKINRVDVTEDDIVRVFEVELDLDIKHDNSLQEQQNIFARYDRLAQNPFVDQYENTAQLIGDDAKIRRMMPSRKKVREQQEEERQAKLEATRAGQAQEQQGAGAEQGVAEQALAGAGAQALGGI